MELSLLDHHENSEKVIVNQPKPLTTSQLENVWCEMAWLSMTVLGVLLDLLLGDAGLWSELVGRVSKTDGPFEE